MSRYMNISCALIYAVHGGLLQEVKKLISKFGLSYSKDWSDGYTLLCDAIVGKHTDITKFLLTIGAEVNDKITERVSNTPLNFAIQNGDKEIVEMLLDRGADLDAKDLLGKTPLNIAIENNRIEITELLLNRGANYSHVNRNGNTTLLHVAVEKGYLEIVKCLLKHGIDVNLADTAAFGKGCTPLCLAVQKGYEEIINVLLRKGANIDARGNDGTTPLHIAVKNNHLQIVERLLKDGAYVDSEDTSTFRKGYTPLFLAVEKCSVEVIKLLLNKGAKVNTIGKYGVTPLHIAVDGGCLQIVENLLEHGACINSAYNDTYRKGYTPLCVAVEKGNEAIIEFFLSKGACIDAKKEGDVTPLHIAAERGHLQLVERFLKYGVPVDSVYTHTSGKRYTPLYLAVRKGHGKVVDLLLKNGADVDAQDKNGRKSNKRALNASVHGYREESSKIMENLLQYGFTVDPKDVNNYKLLYDAVKKGYLKIVQQLLKYGTDVNTIFFKKNYKTPLHIAIRNKQIDVAKLLISYGADVNGEDKDGKTPIFYAIMNTDLKSTELLLINEANVKDNPELLIIAVKKKCREIIEILLQYGVDINACDAYGRTALHFTAVTKHEVNIGRTPFHYNIDDNINFNGEIAKLLLSMGANVNAQTKQGLMTLHVAIMKGYVEVIEALLEYNADVNFKFSNDESPLHLSAKKSNEVISKMLLNKGADVNAKQDDGMTALHIATREGLTKVVEVLLKGGAKVDFKDRFGKTPLHIAAEIGYLGIVKVLLHYDADIDSIQNDGKTALHFASLRKNKLIVETLLKHGSDINIKCENNLFAYDCDHGNVSYYSIYSNSNLHRPFSDYRTTAEIFRYHIVKMKNANRYLSGRNNILPLNDKTILNFENKCEEEIQRMKNKKIHNTNVSLYDILTTEDVSRLVNYARNKNITWFLIKSNYNIKFPIYASMIKSNFRKGRRRKKLLQEANKGFDSMLPYDCTEKVFSYLSNSDLRNVVEAYKPTNTCMTIT